jgi:hypothetical protein
MSILSYTLKNKKKLDKPYDEKVLRWAVKYKYYNVISYLIYKYPEQVRRDIKKMAQDYKQEVKS